MAEAAPARTVLKIFVSAITIFYGFVPALADLNETHLLNPLWSEHARFHTAWFLAFTAGVSGTALFLIWRRDEVFIPITLGLMFSAGFWAATLFRNAYGGALVDSNGHTHTIAGIESNTFLFSVVSILLVATLVAAIRIYRSPSING
ncbi:MAG: DUF6640 family protein [Cohaesibacteraceae bacterium]